MSGQDPLAPMLEARSVALVGASPRAGTFGARMLEEVARSRYDSPRRRGEALDSAGFDRAEL